MEIVKAFNNNTLHTQILIKGTINEPLFRASDIGEILEISNIRSNIQHFTDTERHVDTIYTSTGPKQVTFLTEKGLYKLLFKSRKPIAETFQNWVCEVIKEIRLNGVYDLQKQLEKKETEMQLLETAKNKETEEKLIKQKELEREKVLLNEYASAGNMIYIIRVKTNDDGTYVVKIGESRKGITDRYNECKSKHKQIVLLNCYQVDKSKDFESFLHNHVLIHPHKYKKIEGHEKENELFLIGTTLTYQSLLKIIDDNIDNYNYKVRELLLENQLLKTKLETNQNNINNDLISELIQTNKLLLNKVNSLEQSNHEILNKLNSQQTKVTTGFNQQLSTLGPRLQKINPENLQLVKVYETVTDAMNENKQIKRPSIMKAIQANTIYCGFRWLLVERNLDPNIIHSIKPTKETKIQNLGYIAKLDANKSEILNVYLDRKTASQMNGYQTLSALDNPVKNGTITNGHYYILYTNCDEDLICEFEEKNGSPLLYKNGVGQFDVNGNMTNEYSCKYDCIKELKMSDKTLAKCINKDIAYNGFYYKELGEKLTI
jgi:prophage antirepressor-like protein